MVQNGIEAIYARQSVDKKDSISIETQIDLCRREVMPGVEPIIYFDKGYTGSNTRRPDFQRLMRDVRNGKVRRIIVYRLDRISRSLVDFSTMVDVFDNYRVGFISAQEKFDTSTPIGRAMLNIAMVFAQLEKETIQIRIKDNYYDRGKKGMYLGGPPPYGFTKIDLKENGRTLKLLQEDPETIWVVIRAFELYGLERRTLGEIAKRFNAEMIPTAKGTVWDSSKISKLLRNPVYVMADSDIYRYYSERGCNLENPMSDFVNDHGCYLYGKREANERKYTNVTDHCLALAPHVGVIESELFLKCQRLLDKNTHIDNHNRGKLTWLTGMVKCERCGRSAVPKSSNNGRYTYLYCTGRYHGACGVTHHLGDLKTVESIVEQRIFQWAERYRNVSVYRQKKEDHKAAEIKMRINDCEEKIDKLINMSLEASEATGRRLSEKIDKLDQEKEQLRAQLLSLSSEQDVDELKQIRDLPANWHSLNIAQKNEIASLIIDRILLDKNDSELRVTIIWKFAFDVGD